MNCEEFRRLMSAPAFDPSPEEELTAADHLVNCGDCNTWLKNKDVKLIQDNPKLDLGIIHAQIKNHVYRKNNPNTS